MDELKQWWVTIKHLCVGCCHRQHRKVEWSQSSRGIWSYHVLDKWLHTPPLHCLPKTHMSSFFTYSHSTWHSSLRPLYLSLFYSVIVFACSFNIVNLRSPVLVIFDVGRVSALIKLESSLDTFGLFHRCCSHGPDTVDKQWAMPDLGRHCYL